MRPVSMRAVKIVGAGGVECLTLADCAAPELEPEKVLVRVAAAGLNRADILQRRGFYPAPEGVPADIPGLEFAGTVESLGSAVDGWRPGDRVMGIVGGGAMAEQLCTDSKQLVRIPEHLSFEQAAAVPEAFFTAYDALSQANAQSAKHVLVHAATSGVGTAAVQIARYWDVPCTGTSRSEDKLERVKALGLSRAIVVNDGNFEEQLKALDPPDVVIDLVGGDYVATNLTLIATCGSIVLVGLLGGRKAELDLGLLLRKRAKLIGTVLRSRSTDEKRVLCSSFCSELLPAFEEDRLRPVVDTVLPFSRVADAHTLMESNTTFGKVVLSWDKSA